MGGDRRRTSGAGLPTRDLPLVLGRGADPVVVAGPPHRDRARRAAGLPAPAPPPAPERVPDDRERRVRRSREGLCRTEARRRTRDLDRPRDAGSVLRPSRGGARTLDRVLARGNAGGWNLRRRSGVGVLRRVHVLAGFRRFQGRPGLSVHERIRPRRLPGAERTSAADGSTPHSAPRVSRHPRSLRGSRALSRRPRGG